MSCGISQPTRCFGVPEHENPKTLMNYCVSHSIQMAMNIQHFQMFRNFFCNEHNSLPKKDGFNQQRLEIQKHIRTCCLPSMVVPQDLWQKFSRSGECRNVVALRFCQPKGVLKKAQIEI